jgi:tetratricopeptide (TPR) repeat protein
MAEPTRISRSATFLYVCLAGLVASALYLYAFPSPTIFYIVLVVIHAFGGGFAMLVFLVFLPKLRGRAASEIAGWMIFGAGGVLGCALLFIGTARPQARWLNAHIVVSSLAVVVLGAYWLGARGWMRGRAGLAFRVACLALPAIGIAYGGYALREGRWARSNQIQNPLTPPETMSGEGDGPTGAFFPSSAQTVDGKLIPGKYFMESDACQRCHADIYKQWSSSAHHFSSFNNQWYRKSIEYMQDVVGTKPSKWCGGCHDPAVLYSGKMDTPIKQIVHTPEAQAGLGCMMCHSISKVKSTMGQGDFVLVYPTLHEFAASKNPVVRFLHDYMTRLNPEPHRRVFLKPFMRTQTAEFCSTCHKVHLDVPVNHYRWIRGFNEYDNWQASGVSGQGARSFYYPPKPAQCADCHMPAVESRDDGHVNGEVHSHSFAAANTALPTANQDAHQLEITEAFLKGSVTVDIFALSPARSVQSGGSVSSEQATTFAVGEEAESSVTPGSNGEAAQVTAPLNRVNATVRRGEDVLVDVVVRTRKVGHFFPGGTVDAYDTWVELKATDDYDQVIFWSGKVEGDGKGPVDKGAHFYRSLLVDANGNHINKRNAWSARAVVYVRLIPPGAADTVHYRLHVPENAGARIKLHARLCYRKFSWWNTQFAFAGVPDPAQKQTKVSADFDDRRFVFTGSVQDVSAKRPAIPDLPIIAIDEDEVQLNVASRGGRAEVPKTVLTKDDWTRWNDYGIGLFLQGDLKDARAAFEKITQIDERNPDGWVNLGRVAVQEGDMERARQVLQKALALSPTLARANFFYAKVLRNDGDYDGAAQHLRLVLEQYPRDRVALNDLGRILFLRRQYSEAVGTLNNVLLIDPEDLQAHYNLMLCYQGLGKEQEAQRERKLYARLKADEAAQAITGPYRRLHPEDNNERQSIHEHVSIPLNAERPKQPAKVALQKERPASGGGR